MNILILEPILSSTKNKIICENMSTKNIWKGENISIIIYNTILDKKLTNINPIKSPISVPSIPSI